MLFREGPWPLGHEHHELAGVGYVRYGEPRLEIHMVRQVDLSERPYLADVGFGYTQASAASLRLTVEGVTTALLA